MPQRLTNESFWRSHLDCSESPSHIGRFLHDYCGNQAGRNAGRKRWSFPYLPDARLPEVTDRLTSFTPDYIVSKFMYKGGSQAVPCHIANIESSHQWPQMLRPGGCPKKQQKSVQLWSSMGFFIDFLLASFLISMCLVQESEPLEFLSHENPQSIEVC